MANDLARSIQEWAEAWNTGNLNILDLVFTKGVTYHMPPFPDMVGLDVHKSFIADARRSYPDFHLTIDEIIVQGETTATRWTWRGTFAGPSASIPIPPTGRAGTAIGCHITHWVDGKVAETWHIGDWLGLLQQHGVLPPMR